MDERSQDDMTLTKQIAVTALLLAICVASQFFKSLSVFVTGPIVNLCIVLAVMTAGLQWGVILSVITPVTAFFIAPSPVMQAVIWIIPMIMLGNAVLAVMTHFIFAPSVKTGERPLNMRSALLAAACAMAKGAVMGLTISLWLLPTFIPAESPLRAKMPVFQTTFSVVQFATALIGFVYFFIIWIAVGRSEKDNGK